MSSPLYRTAGWLRRRAYQLAHEPLCRLCKALGNLTPATVADHIEPHGGDVEKFWSGELQSLCASCHSSVKQAQEKGKGIRGCDTSGQPVDPSHPWNNGEGEVER